MHDMNPVGAGPAPEAAGSRMTGRLLLGLVVIGLGVLFTLDNMGAIEAGDLLRWWPALIVLYGLSRLFGMFGRPNILAGTIVTLIGGWLLLHSLDILGFDFFGFWSIVLIVLGVSIVSSALRRGGSPGDGSQTSPALSAFAFMSGTTRVIGSQEFRGGDITAIMGGHKIDLRGARLANGVASIDLLIWWGGVDLIVPEDWEVSSEGVVLMGGIEDAGSERLGDPAVATTRQRLILKGLVLMGGVDVKRKPR